jgi:hypothetical protein
MRRQRRIGGYISDQKQRLHKLDSDEAKISPLNFNVKPLSANTSNVSNDRGLYLSSSDEIEIRQTIFALVGVRISALSISISKFIIPLSLP